MPAKVSLWSEFMPYATVESYLPLLDREGVGLYLAVRAASLDDDEFYRLWDAATRRGMEIRPWLLLSEADGYWANKWNPAKIENLVWLFLEKLTARGLSTKWITIDIEPPPDFNRALTNALGKRDLIGAWKTLVSYSKSGNYYEAENRYRELVARLHAMGIQVHCVTSPFVLHDLGNQTRRVQSALGTPVQGIPWDDVSFMVYRPEFRKLMGNVTEDIVYKYARIAHKALGDRAAIDLGEVGMVTFPGVTQGYTDPKELGKDYSAARAAGIDRIHVYSVDGLIPTLAHQPELLDAWLVPPPAKKPKRDVTSRFFLWALDLVASFLPSPKH